MMSLKLQYSMINVLRFSCHPFRCTRCEEPSIAKGGLGVGRVVAVEKKKKDVVCFFTCIFLPDFFFFCYQ